MYLVQSSMDSANSHCERLLVAAIDFGTTFSGYAFSFRDSPLDIKYNPTWVAGSEKLISLKTPTCVLLKPNKEFHSFGFEAENKYSDLAEDDQHHGWYMFRRFKMALYETKDLHMDTTIEDLSGKKMPAVTIFGHSIRYLNNHLLKTLGDQAVGIVPEDIQYVITVPAIWDQKAKQFMRKAANEGGIKDNQLRIALEPEAASIWCQVATDHKLSGLADPGSKYMVVDLGGGTADITVHAKMMDGTLKEMHQATGGSWGGVQVDKAYIQMLADVVGEAAMEKFKTENVGDYFDLLRDFETKKRTITTDTAGRMTFKIPAALKDCAESKKTTMKDLVEKSKYRGKMAWAGDKIRIEKTVAKELFDKTIMELTLHVRELFTDPQTNEAKAILLVGGFGECELVKEAFGQMFRDKRLIIPAEAGLAVLKGAVRFGHLPQIVSVRVARFTYGREVWPIFVENYHDERKKFTQSGKSVCKEVFEKIVAVDEAIPVGKEVECKGSATFDDQLAAAVKIFSSRNKHPKYVTDEGCIPLGTICVDLPRSENIRDKDHTIFLSFGDTELKVRVLIDKTNTSSEIVINCLN